MNLRLLWRRFSYGAGRRLRTLAHADLGRGVVALLMAGGIAVAVLVLIEVRHLSRTADEVKDRAPTVMATVELAATTYSEISSKIQVVLTRMDEAEIANREAVAGFHERQDQLLERTQATEREVKALRSKVEALIVIEEARREAQIRFDRWLEEAEAQTTPEGEDQ